LSEEDYELRWPRQLLRDELGELVNEPSSARWKDRATLTLNDAFTTPAPADEFSELCDAPPPRLDPWATPQQDPAPARSA